MSEAVGVALMVIGVEIILIPLLIMVNRAQIRSEIAEHNDKEHAHPNLSFMSKFDAFAAEIRDEFKEVRRELQAALSHHGGRRASDEDAL